MFWFWRYITQNMRNIRPWFPPKVLVLGGLLVLRHCPAHLEMQEMSRSLPHDPLRDRSRRSFTSQCHPAGYGRLWSLFSKRGHGRSARKRDFSGYETLMCFVLWCCGILDHAPEIRCVDTSQLLSGLRRGVCCWITHADSEFHSSSEPPCYGSAEHVSCSLQ